MAPRTLELRVRLVRAQQCRATGTVGIALCHVVLVMRSIWWQVVPRRKDVCEDPHFLFQQNTWTLGRGMTPRQPLEPSTVCFSQNSYPKLICKFMLIYIC